MWAKKCNTELTIKSQLFLRSRDSIQGHLHSYVRQTNSWFRNNTPEQTNEIEWKYFLPPSTGFRYTPVHPSRRFSSFLFGSTTRQYSVSVSATDDDRERFFVRSSLNEWTNSGDASNSNSSVSALQNISLLAFVPPLQFKSRSLRLSELII